ncbi:MAG TPA: hypothetical protein VLG28_01230 [Acidimicrobiia bacterium]|jgi:streptomycin 3"-adenylyltransferase|nr:hypothetical protein [Acidimicrobiia bacterium]
MNEADRAHLRDVVDCTLAVLGGNAVGVYLYGSAVLSELRPRSDLDVFAVVAGGMRHDERIALLAGLMPLSGLTAVPSN